MIAQLEDLSVYCHVTGPVGANLGTVCLLHCFGSDHRFWDMQLSWLSGYRVLRPDARGHGASSRPAGPYSISQMADDVIALLDHLGIERVHLAGASMGGMAAQEIAARHPDRVQSLLLVTTTFEYSLPQRDAWQGLIRQVQQDGISAVERSLMARWFSRPTQHRNGAGYQYMVKAFRRFHPEAFVAAAHAVRSVDLGWALPNIKAPTQVIASENDPGVPVALSRALATRIPAAAFLFTPFAHHLASLEHPAVVGWQMRRFLDRVSGETAAPVAGAPI